MLFMTLACRALERGDNIQAAVTVINAFCNHPEYIENIPDAVVVLAQAMDRDFDDELNRLQTRHPMFGIRLEAELHKLGKFDLIQKRKANFSDFCVARTKAMRAANVAEYGLPIRDAHDLDAQMSGEFSQFPYIPKPPRLYAIDQAGMQEKTWASLENDEARQMLSDMNLPAMPKRFRSRRIGKHPPYDASKKEEFPDDCQNTASQAVPYIDDPAKRVILDFDDKVPQTPKSTLFAPSLTKFRSFQEDRDRAKNDGAQRFSNSNRTMTALERVAEKTYAMSDSPSVEPYEAHRPLRFHVSQKQIIVCVLGCLFITLLWITYRNTVPEFEKKAVQSYSFDYISAMESGIQNVTEDPHDLQNFFNASWFEGYKLFIAQWQNIYFEHAEVEFLDPRSRQFPVGNPAAQSAYILQEISRRNFAEAAAYYENVLSKNAKLWRGHAYFKTWNEAVLAQAARQYEIASQKYEKLLTSPLSAFALVQIGFLAIQARDDYSGIKDIFLSQMSRWQEPSALALCAQAVLEGSQTTAWVRQIDRLKPEYRNFCSIGRIYSEISHHVFSIYSSGMRDYLELSMTQSNDQNNTFRLEALVEASLLLNRMRKATAYYQQMDLPEYHPARIRLQNEVLRAAMKFGNWEALHMLFKSVPKDMNFLSASRIMDDIRNHRSIRPVSLTERMLVYGSGWILPSSDTGIGIDAAYALACHGDFSNALKITRQLLGADPRRLEPLFLQAMILSRNGQIRDAIQLLERQIRIGFQALPLFVMSSLYRARAGMTVSTSYALLRHMVFSDPVLESARCEIFWRANDRRYAETCLDELQKSTKKIPKSAWLMLNGIENSSPSGSKAVWEKANSGDMSFPGFQLAYARVLAQAKEVKKATRHYLAAILYDPVSSTPETVQELEHIFSSSKRRYEGTKCFENLAVQAKKMKLSSEMQGMIHLSAARLYQPKLASSDAKRHLVAALALLGNRPEIIRGFIEYYKAKDRQESVSKWRMRLKQAMDLQNNGI